MQQVSLVVFVLYILWLFVKDAKRRVGISRSVWMVVVWLIIVGSRPVSSWFNFGGDGGSQAEAYDSGNPIERQIYFILIAAGLYTLWKRGVRLREFVQNNRWLVIFFLFWGVSVLWSDAPFVSFKRWFKDLGNIVMILVLLTEENPYEAVKAAFARCAFVLLPFSVLFIKFYSELGRAYHPWSGEMMYTGVTTHKNSLGGCALVLGLFLMWDFLSRQQAERGRKDWLGYFGDLSLLGMALWLLYEAHSSTSQGSAMLGVITFLGLSLPLVRSRVKHLELYLIGGAMLVWLLDSVLDVQRLVVVDILGRDLTLTTRTEVWPMLLKATDGVLLGCGFNSFWSGERLAVIYNQLGIIQAHNGYLETYLNGGLFGVTLLIVMLLMAGKSIKSELLRGGDYAKVRMMFLIVAIAYNFTEAAFNKMGIIWFASLLVVTQYPRQPRDSSLAFEPSSIR